MTVMIAAIRKAARGVQRDYGEVSSLQVAVKGPADFVTNSDKKAEKILREELLAARPTYGVLVKKIRKPKALIPITVSSLIPSMAPLTSCMLYRCLR